MAVETEELKWLLIAEDKATPILENLIKKLADVEKAVDSVNAKLNNIGGKTSANQNSIVNANRTNIDTNNKVANAVEKTNNAYKKQLDLIKSVKKTQEGITSQKDTYREFSNGKRIDTTYNVDPETEYKDESNKKVVETTLPEPKKLGEVVQSTIGEIKSSVKNLATGITEIKTSEVTDNEKVDRSYIQIDDGTIILKNEKRTPFGEPPKTPPKGKTFGERYEALRGEGKGAFGAFFGALNLKDFGKRLKETTKINSKFVKSFGRIALYRAIRTVLSSVVNLFKDGFTNIAATSTQARDSLIQLKTFSTSLSISLSSMLIPAVSALASLLEPLSYSLINTANAMAREQAIASGASTYYKINAEAVEDYAKQLQGLNGQLTQLDKFATLSQGTPILGGEVSIDTPAVESSDLEKTTIQSDRLATTISKIVDSVKELAIWLSEMDISEIKELAAILLWFTGIPGQIIAVISAFKTLFSKDATLGAKALAAAIIGLTFAVIAFKIAVAGGLAVPTALAVASILGVASTGSWLLLGGITTGFGNGGSPDIGSTSISNATIPSLSSNIGLSSVETTNGQLSESVSSGVYNAVSRAFAENKSSGSGDVYLDSKKVGTVIASGVYSEGVKAGYWNK